MFVAAPNCPRGYSGPGGITDDGRFEGCTGGIYRYIDVQLLGEEHIYHGAAVTYVYGGNNFECEGFMGIMNAILLAFLGTLVCKIFQSVKDPWKCVRVYFEIGVSLLLAAGLLCGFRQFDGYMPINKNKWNTSFIAITSGVGFCVFGLTYMLVDVLKVWSGYPYRAVGMNSILIYVVHEFVGGYIPFSFDSECRVMCRYQFEQKNHWTTMTNSYLLGVGMWILIANKFYREKMFFKISSVSWNKEKSPIRWSRIHTRCHTRLKTIRCHFPIHFPIQTPSRSSIHFPIRCRFQIHFRIQTLIHCQIQIHFPTHCQRNNCPRSRQRTPESSSPPARPATPRSSTPRHPSRPSASPPPSCHSPHHCPTATAGRCYTSLHSRHHHPNNGLNSGTWDVYRAASSMIVVCVFSPIRNRDNSEFCRRSVALISLLAFPYSSARAATQTHSSSVLKRLINMSMITSTNCLTMSL